MDEPYKIDDDALYDDNALWNTLRLSEGTLSAARKSGALKFVRRGTRVLYTGAWVRQWLVKDPAGEVACA
jgi:hypothetical protein